MEEIAKFMVIRYRKRLVSLFILLLLSLLLNACSLKTTDNNLLGDKKTNSTNAKEKVISAGKNFKVINIGKGEERKFRFFIYDSNKKIVKQGEVERMEPLISYIDAATLEIRFNGGTSAILCQYYDIPNNLFSQQFWNPEVVQNRLVVYTDGKDKSIKLIVQNIFDTKLFYREYLRDFSQVTTPIKSAKFIDKEHLEITYFKGKNLVGQNEVIDLGKN